MRNRFSAAISEHPIPTTAVGEVAGHLLEHDAQGCDLLCVFVSPHHAGALEDIAKAFRTLIDPKVLIGCAAEAVIGPGREVEDGPAISAWCGNVGPVEPLRLVVVENPVATTGKGSAIAGWPIDLEWVPAGAILFTDPFSFPATALFEVLNSAGGFPRVVGGMASSGTQPGGNRIVLNDAIFDDGAVGVLIGANDEIWMEGIVSQGCRPVGSPYVVTSAENNVIYELGGVPALNRLNTMMREELSETDVALAREGLLIGRVINESKAEFSQGDFLIRTFLGADYETGALTVGDRIEIGTTVQFHVRDANTADADIRNMLSNRKAEAMLMFSCNGRGVGLFEEADHDAGVVVETIGDIPVAGFFGAGEFGPVAGRNYLHGFSAAMALFDLPTTDPDNTQT